MENARQEPDAPGLEYPVLKRASKARAGIPGISGSPNRGGNFSAQAAARVLRLTHSTWNIEHTNTPSRAAYASLQRPPPLSDACSVSTTKLYSGIDALSSSASPQFARLAPDFTDTHASRYNDRSLCTITSSLHRCPLQCVLPSDVLPNELSLTNSESYNS